jgi:hypothetical protein
MKTATVHRNGFLGCQVGNELVFDCHRVVDFLTAKEQVLEQKRMTLILLEKLLKMKLSETKLPKTKLLKIKPLERSTRTERSIRSKR